MNFFNLILPQVEFLQDGKCLPSREGGNVVVSQVRLDQLGHILDQVEVLKLIVHGLNTSDVGVTSPTLVDFLNLVVTDIEELKLGALDRREGADLDGSSVQVFKIWELLFLGEQGQRLHLVSRDVDFDEVGHFF